MSHFILLNGNTFDPLPTLLPPIGGGDGGNGTPHCGISQIGKKPGHPKPPRGGRGSK